MSFAIYELEAGGGRLAVAPMPGRSGTYSADVARLLAWDPALVLTMTTAEELERAGASGLPDDLAACGVAWRHLPIPDFGTPPDAVRAAWPAVADDARAILQTGGRVLAHCWGGQGRSGMAVLRLMVEGDEVPDHALARLRDVRPGAVETSAQLAWPAQPGIDGRHGD